MITRRIALVLVAAAGCAGGESEGGSGALTLGDMTSGTDGGSDDGGPGPGSDPTIPDPDDSGETGMGPGDTTNPAGTTGIPPDCVPVDEICDGMDNDCDGMVDEDDGSLGTPCDTGLPGPCMSGATTCEGGLEICDPQIAPTAEMCDGVDNDCNGMVDDGDPEAGANCDTGMPGICSAGTTSCSGGAVVCNQNMAAQTEVCNASDDDCDGTPDDGNPGGGAGCSTGMPGICAAGTETCTAGSISCVQDQNSVAEICGNGLDDDCDGTVDDGCSCPLGLCEIGVGTPMTAGCDPCVDQVCAADPFCCSNNWDSLCVGQVETVCGQANCISTSCAHLICDVGPASTPLSSTCHPCVGSVCAADAFCCGTDWDQLCVNAIATQCNLSCP